MPLTRPFKETIAARAQRDAKFRVALLTEGAELLLSGEIETAKAVLRDYINATIGFESLASAVDIPSKSLMRMFSATGNPQASNLFAVLRYLQESEGIELKVRAVA